MDGEPTTGSTLATRLSSSRLVGRQAELALLVETASRAPAVAFVEGEGGVGKSRLVAELLRSVPRPDRVRLGRCHPQRDPFPLEPVVEACRDLGRSLRGLRLDPVVGRLRFLLPELAPYLPFPPETAGPDRVEQHQVFRAFRELFIAIGPTTLVLEDVHWADGATAELLHFLLGAPPPELSVILTWRSEDLPESSPVRSLASRLPANVAHAHVALKPLDPAGVAELVVAILEADEMTDEFARHLHERTGGIPFAVEEVLRLLQERRDLVQRDGRWERRAVEKLQVPGAIREAVVQRLGGLSPGARRLVSAAAVLGVPVGEEGLAGVAEMEEAEAAAGLSEALNRGLLREDDQERAGFRHDLARQAVYEAVAGPDRRRMHLRAATLLQQDRSCPAARLADHFRQAGRLDDWAHYAEQAGDQAVLRFDEAAACRIFEELLALPSLEVDDRVRLARKLGMAALAWRAQREAAEALARVLGEDLPTGLRAELRFLRALTLMHCGDESAMAELAACIPDLADQPTLAARAMSILAFPTSASGHVDEHLEWMERAMKVAATVPNPMLERTVLRNRAAVLLSVGDARAWAEIEEMFGKGRTMADRREQAHWMTTLARAAAFLGHDRRAAEFVAQARELCEEIDFSQPLRTLSAIELLLDWWGGRWDGLEERCRVVLAEDNRSPLAPILATLVRDLVVLVRAGATEDQETGGPEQGLRTLASDAGGTVPAMVLASGALARRQLSQGDPARAHETAGSALDIVQLKGLWVWGGEAAVPAVEALIALGRTDEADKLVIEFADGLEGRDAPAAFASLAVCRGMIEGANGDSGAAATCFEEAATAFAALPRPYDGALASERAGRALIEAEPDRAVGFLVAALAVETMGATTDAARVRHFVREHNVALPYPWRGGRRGFGDALSPREQEILDLADTGLAGRQIAERLSVSVRTVESHLWRARRKQRGGEGADPEASSNIQ